MSGEIQLPVITDNRRMRDTPCLNCLRLRLENGKYQCGATREPLENSIVLGQEPDLPACPFFVYRTDQILTDEENLVGVENNHQRRRRSRDETYGEIVQVIKKFHKRKGYWPTQKNILYNIDLKSNGNLYNYLTDMVQLGRIKRMEVIRGGRPQSVYEIVPRNVRGRQ